MTTPRSIDQIVTAARGIEPPGPGTCGRDDGQRVRGSSTSGRHDSVSWRARDTRTKYQAGVSSARILLRAMSSAISKLRASRFV